MKTRAFSRLIGCALAGVLCVSWTPGGVAGAGQAEEPADLQYVLTDTRLAAAQMGQGRLVIDPVWERYSRRPRLVEQLPAAPPLHGQTTPKRRVKAKAPTKRAAVATPVPPKPAAVQASPKSATDKPEGGVVTSLPVQTVAPRAVTSPGVTALPPKTEPVPPKVDATPPHDGISASWIMPRPAEEKTTPAQSSTPRH